MFLLDFWFYSVLKTMIFRNRGYWLFRIYQGTLTIYHVGCLTCFGFSSCSNLLVFETGCETMLLGDLGTLVVVIVFVVSFTFEWVRSGLWKSFKAEFHFWGGLNNGDSVEGNVGLRPLRGLDGRCCYSPSVDVGLIYHM